MYEQKKIVKLLTNKFFGTGPSFYKKKYLQGRGLKNVEKHWYMLPNRGVHWIHCSLRCFHDDIVGRQCRGG